MTSARLRTLRRGALFALFGLVAYGAALMFCFPYERVRDMAVAIAARNGIDLEVASVGPSFPFGILFEDLRLRSRAAPPGGKPPQARLDSARLGMIPLFLSRGSSFDADVVGLAGQIQYGVHVLFH